MFKKLFTMLIVVSMLLTINYIPISAMSTEFDDIIGDAWQCTHKWVYDSKKDATCLTDGHEAGWRCDWCDEKQYATIKALGHDIVVDKEVAPTCTETGLTAGEHCTRCDYKIAQDVVDALGHTPGKAADCENAQTCTVCGEELAPKLGHTPGEAVIENNTAPDCDTAGSYDSVVYCTVCGEELSRETIPVDALGHTPGEAVIENNVDPDCDTAGSYDRVVYCTVCKAEVSRETVSVDALGHKYDAIVTAPDCVNGGYTTYTCSVCGDTYTDNNTEALGHTNGAPVVENNVAADCENAGSYDNVVYCTVCGKEISRVTITVDALGHTAGDAVIENNVDPDCVNKGSYDNVTYCTVCGDELSREKVTVDATGHTAGKDADCENAQVCTVCGAVVTPAIGHNYKVVVTAPDCVNGGYTTYTCSVCGDTYTDNKTDALGHTPGEAVIENNVAPDCDTAGSYDSVVYCTVCGEELSRETIPVDALGHKYDSVVTDPTCTAEGYTTYTCSVCDHSYVADKVAATGHSYVDGVCSCGDTKIPVQEDIKEEETVKEILANPVLNAPLYDTTRTDVDSLEVSVVAVDGGKITFSVNPMKAGSKVESFDVAFTFRLPIPVSAEEKYAIVYHAGEFHSVYEIKGSGDAKYVEVVAYDFSEYAVELHDHSWSDATCTEAQKCSCGETQGVALGHSFVEGACTVCGASDPDYVAPVAKIGETKYATIEEALAAAKSGDEIVLLADVDGDITIPAGVIFNGNEFVISGGIIAEGEITFAGVTKARDFDVVYTNTTVNIPVGATLELTGTDRMVIGHGCIFNITGNITDAKTANVADLTPSLIVAAGASFTGTDLTFNVTKAYVKFNGNSTSKNKSANGTFNFNINNSIWEQTGVLAFYVPTEGMDPTFNLNLKDSVLTTTSHLVFAVTKGEIVIDNSNVNVGKSNQIENRSTMTIKNGSVVNGAVATSSNAINSGTIIVEDATYAVTGQFSGSTVGTGTLIIKSGATVSVGSIVDKANIVIDATDMSAGDEVNFTANLSKFAGELSVINNDELEAKIVDGKIVIVIKPVAKIGETYYATLAEAIAAAQSGDEIVLLDNIKLTSTLQIEKSITLNGNGFTVDMSDNFGFALSEWPGTEVKVTFTALTFTGYAGSAQYDAAIIIGSGAVGVIEDCMFTGNSGSYVIRSDGGEMTVEDCVFNDNRVQKAVIVSGVNGHSASVAISGSTFSNNTVAGTAVVYLNKGSATATGTTELKNNTFINNYITANAAAVLYLSVPVTMQGTLLKDNAVIGTGTSGDKCGIIATGSGAGGSKIVENVFVGNTVSTSGANFVATAWIGSDNVTVNGNYWSDGAIPEQGNGADIYLSKSGMVLETYATSYVESNTGAIIGGVESALSPVAEINGVKYTDLQEAIAAAQNGETITLLADLEIVGETFTIPAGKSLTLDMNGKKITATDNKSEKVSYELFYIYGELTVTGNGTIELTSTSNDTAWAKYSTIFHNRGGVFTVENGTFKHLGGTCMAYVIDNSANSFGDATTTINGGVLTSAYIGIRNRMDTYGANGGGNGIATLNVNGGEISGKYAVWGQVSSAGVKGAINVTGGKLTGADGKAALLADDDATGEVNVAVSGGSFSYPIADEFCAEGFVPKDNGDGTYGVIEHTCSYTEQYFEATFEADAYTVYTCSCGDTYTVTHEGTKKIAVATVNGEKFESLQDAIDAAQSGDTVTLLTDIELTETLTVNGTVTLELNGKKLSGVNAAAEASAVIKNNGNLTIQDTVGNGIITSKALNPDLTNKPVYANNTISNFGTLTVKSGIIENASTGYACYAIDNYSGSATVIEGGIIRCVNGSNGDSIRLFASASANTSLVVTGGEIGTIWTQNPSNNKVTDVLYSVTIKDGATVGTLYLEPTANANVAITGGNIDKVVLFKVDDENPERNASGFISGGIFSSAVPEDFCAEGFIPKDNGDGTYGVIEHTCSYTEQYFEATFEADAYTVYTCSCGDTYTVTHEGTKKIAVATVNGEKFESLADAIAAAQDSDTVKLLSDVTITELIKIEKAITLDLGGNKVTATSQKAFEIYADATIMNGTIEAAQRCVDTRKAVELTLADVNLIADKYTSYGNQQPLTIGGSENGTIVNLNNVTIDAGTQGYAIITFVETEMNAVNSDISGYMALYVKAGSEGSEFNFENSTLTSDITGNDVAGNATNIITVEASDITVNVTGGALVANGVNQTAIALRNVTGTELVINAEITAPAILKNADAENNTIIVPAQYADELVADGYAYITNGDGTVTAHTHVYEQTGYTDPTFEADAYTVYTCSCGDTYTVTHEGTKKIAVATVNGTKYESLQDAENAAEDGDTIVLLENIELTTYVTFYDASGVRNVTLDMNDKTITLTERNYAALWVCDNLTITGNGKIIADPAGDAPTEGNAAAYAIIVGSQGTSGNLVIENGTFYSDDSSVISVTHGSATILGGTFESAGDMDLNCIDDMFAAGKASIVVKGGKFYGFNPQNNASEGAGTNFCADGYVALPDLNGNYVVGEKPSATVNNLGATTVPAGDYTALSGVNTVDMPLSFVMQFLADQNAEDMANSPFADWYGDFVITFTGIENDSFDTTGCYLAGYYGDFGWVKVPVDGLLDSIENDVHYPVMLGVGMGQKYDYICTGVKDFRCAMYIPEEILAANPNLKVTLELAVVDNSQGEDAAANALINNENVYKVAGEEYVADDFVINYVAEVNGTKYTSLQDAIDAAQNGETIVIIDDVTLTEALTIAAGKTVTLDLAGYTIVYNSTTQGEAMITNRGTLTINDSVGTGVINYNYTGAADPSYSKGNYTISNGGTLTVNGGKITIANLSAHAKYPIDNNSTSGDAILVINGGHLYNYNTAAIRQFCNSTTNKNSVTINGGVVEGYSAIWVQNPGSKTVNGSLTITGGEIKSTAKAYVNGTATLKDVASKIYFTVNGDGGAWSEDSFVSITGGIFNENVYLATNAPTSITVDDTAATFNGRIELPKVYVAQIGETKYESLAEAFAAAKDGDTIELLCDITYSKDNGVVNGEYVDGLLYTGDKSFTVDFGGFTITDNGEINDYLVYLKNTGSKDNEITFKNGKIIVNSENTVTTWAAITVGANSATHKTTLNLEGMEIVNGNPNDANNQVIRIRNGSTVNLNNGTVVTSNGTSYGVVAETGSIVNVNDGAKVVHTNSKTTMGNQVYTALSGNGTINVYGGAVIESDRYAIHNMTSGNAVINIYGGTITAPVAVRASTNGGAGESATVTISGGTINGELETYSDAASIEVSGGSFNTPVEYDYCASGFIPKDNGDGTYGVKEGQYVAEVNGTKYESLADAIAAAQDGETVTLLADVTSSEIITIDKAITLDGNGKKLTSTAARAINVSGADGVTIKNLTIDCSGERAINVIQNATNVTIDNVTATASNYTVNVASSAPNAVVAISNSTLNGLCTVNVAGAGARVTITDSTINCNDNNTTVGESYAALSLNKDAVGGSIVATNCTVNVTDGSDSYKGRNGAEDGTVTINGSTDDVLVTVAVITYAGSSYYHGFATLADAIEFAKDGDTITLIRDVTLSEAVVISGNKNVVIDLNGKTISSTTHTFNITGSSLTLKNGTIISGARAILSKGSGTSANVISLYNVVMNADSVGIYHNGSAYGIDLTVNNSEINGSDYGIFISGTDTWSVLNKITIEKSTVIGDTALEAKYTDISVTDSTLVATEEEAIRNSTSGSCTVGFAIALTNNTVNGTVVATKGSIMLYGENDITGRIMVKAEGAVDVISNVSDQLAIPADYKWVASGENYALAQCEYVAQVGETKYESLADAIAAAQDGETITLLADVNEAVSIEKSITLDLNGKTLSSSSDTVSVLNGATVTIKNGTLVSDGEYCGGVYVKNASAILENCTIKSTNTESAYAVYASSYANVTITGCDLIAKDYAVAMLNANVTVNSGTFSANSGVSANGTDIYDDATLTINGGTFNGSIYWPASGKLTVNGGTFTDETAIYVKSGSLEINGGTFTGNGEAKDYAFKDSGFNPTGAAIVIENVGISEYDAIASVAINGGTFISVNNVAIQSVTAGHDGVEAVSGFITGGSFGGAVAEEFCAEGYHVLDADGDGIFVGEAHTYGEEVTDPTCTTDGYTTYTCACGHTYKANEITATGHSYESVVTPPTATEKGYTTHTCSVCGDSYVDSYVFALNVVAVDENGNEYEDLYIALRTLYRNGGGTLTLVKDILGEFDLTVYKGVTLDLNGYILETEYISVFNGGYLVDNSSANTGLLKCSQEGVIIQTEASIETGAMSSGNNVAVWNEEMDGYMFTNYAFTGTKLEVITDGEVQKLQYKFAFVTEKYVRGILSDGVTDNDLVIAVRITWTKTDASGNTITYHEDVHFSDAQTGEVISANGTRVFTLKLANYENFDNLGFQSVVISGSGMTVYTAPISASSAAAGN